MPGDDSAFGFEEKKEGPPLLTKHLIISLSFADDKIGGAEGLKKSR
jgi:hypothetical protein